MTPITRRQAIQYGVASAALGAGALHSVQAQVLPDTARLLVGFPAGGAPDYISRNLAQALTGKLAKSVIVDNRPGAAGRIAVDLARQAPADGTTLLLNPAGVLSIYPHSYRKLNYDPFKDFQPLSLAVTIDFGFGVGPAVPPEVKTFADFVVWAKANSGKVTFASPAAGAPPHFVGDVLSRALDLGMTHVPYRGGTPAMSDLMGGQVSAIVLTLGDMIEYHKAGRLRLLAATGPSRPKFSPQTPTFAELKVPSLDLRDWYGVYIAGNPPAELQARLAAVVREAVASQGFTLAMLKSNLEATPSSPQELDKLARRDLERWGPIVKASGFVADN